MGFLNGKELKGMMRVSYTLKDKEQDKDMNKDRLIKLLKVS